MIDLIAGGTLIGDPLTRTAESGESFSVALLRVIVLDAEPIRLSLVAFGKPGRQLARCKAGDSIAVAGHLRMDPSGLGVTMTAILSREDIQSKPKPRAGEHPHLH